MECKSSTVVSMCILVLLSFPEKGQQQHAPSLWQQINLNPVCFSARGKSPGLARYLGSEGKLVAGIKLVYREGNVRCAHNTAHNSRWGCSNYQELSKFPLNVVVTDGNDNVIFPLEKYIRNRGLWYNLPFTDPVHSDEVVFTEYAHPFYLAPRSIVKIWYGEDLRDWKNSDNGGRVCVDVYAHFE